MTLAAWYWLAMFLWVIFAVWRDRADPSRWGTHGLAFFLFVLIGLHDFGSPFK